MIQYICGNLMLNNRAKIHLSPQESELVLNKDWLFLKQSVLDKVLVLLGLMHEKYKDTLAGLPPFLPSDIKTTGGKISRGENHKGLPYLILDFPAQFSKENIFAIRTLFWWGNYFSITLHLSGKYFSSTPLFYKELSLLGQRGFYVYTGADEWDHEVGAMTHVFPENLTAAAVENLKRRNFCKIVKTISLMPWDRVPVELEESFRHLCNFVDINFRPGGETSL